MSGLIGGSSVSQAFAPIPPANVLSRRSFNEEVVRLASYNAMAPLEGCQCHPLLMAKGGLYYTGPDDAVQCYSCSTILTQWRSQGVDPIQLHRQSSPQCAHVREQENTNNIPIVAPDDAATQTIKEWLREKCAELDQNPTQVYFDITRTFSEIGGVSRGEMFGADPELESSGPAALVPPESAHGPGLGGDVTEVRVDRSRLSSSPGIDFELCKSSITERLKTFETWPLAAQVHPHLLAEAGFVYTGPQDRVQCVYCEGSLRNWQEGDVPSDEHARHFPTCPMVVDDHMTAPAPVAGPSVSFVEHSRHTPPHSLSGVPVQDGPGANAQVPRRELLGIVTDRPKHPQMSIEAARIGSYISWPTGKSQTPQQLAKAGFFYAGFNDSVKCFFCDGGLRNWEREDDPWHEHARWFPRCKYVRQVKGDQFVAEVLADENGRVQQTAVYEGPDRGSNSPVVGEGERSRRRSGSAGRDSAERRKPVEQREVMARMDTPMVRAVLNMDIPQDLVLRAIEHRLRTTGDDFPSMEALLETVFELSASHPASTSGEPSPVNTGSPVRRPASGEPLAAVEAPRSLIEENRQLKEQRTCKICMDEEVCVVFVPCGHLVCCATCAPPLSKCPICRSTIRGTVRTYMS